MRSGQAAGCLSFCKVTEKSEFGSVANDYFASNHCAEMRGPSMMYSLYIYKSTAVTVSAPAIDICNRAVSTAAFSAWGENEAADYMVHFDTHEIATKIYALAGEKCRVSVKKPLPEHGEVEYLHIATSYVYAPTVLPYIHCVAAENDLVLYDAETKRTFFRDLVNRTFINVKSRIADYKRAISTEMKPIWMIRKIGVSRTERDHDYAYIVTLKKDIQKSFADRCADFYRCLSNQLSKDEELSTSNECFTIVGKWYTISFCLEGYKKHPNQMGYYAQGLPQTKLIRRMGCEEGFIWLKQNGICIAAILERMNFRELKQAYPNQADRFIASVNIQKWESRERLYIRYCGLGRYGSEILFHIVPNGYYADGSEISALAIEECGAEPILSIIDQFYPYFYKRYHLKENHLPIEMWADIVEAARKKKEKLVNSQKYHDAKVLDVFIRWSESQLNLYISGDGQMFNIQGP